MVFWAIFLIFKNVFENHGIYQNWGIFFENYNYESQDCKSLFVFFFNNQPTLV
jgi:hypothetical protein